MSKLENIQACVFDAYGTLFDVNAAAERCRDSIGENAGKLAEIWRLKQLQYTWLRSLMDEYEDFWAITGQSLDFALNSLGMSDPKLRARLMELYLELDTYPEVSNMLKTLKDSGMKTAILSNGSPSMLLSAVKNAGIYQLLDQTISVDTIGVYKPHPGVYQLAVDGLDVAAENICFLSSNGWDAHGAAHFGFQVVWINRFGQKRENLPGVLADEISTLDQLPALIGIGG
ncbi:MAG: haloacid dehalogenase type II [Rhodospirillales bacterium]|nr:haloacid dehalogenase type II [Rhodospirillales bacterium]MCW8862729.1 haloacid dehalogenase type II [Rhodospirillales bacterium]MCW8951748.1 haloacid dehalogenase type II [Rhodospirillales bacterium]MCW8971049.1 haloacid dehalogenase type II [Rhodospirillales bacterium]MCW9003423.1 haloacid dehalogenase type II [Rhodospirillales bacterium]